MLPLSLSLLQPQRIPRYWAKTPTTTTRPADGERRRRGQLRWDVAWPWQPRPRTGGRGGARRGAWPGGDRPFGGFSRQKTKPGLSGKFSKGTGLPGAGLRLHTASQSIFGGHSGGHARLGPQGKREREREREGLLPNQTFPPPPLPLSSSLSLSRSLHGRGFRRLTEDRGENVGSWLRRLQKECPEVKGGGGGRYSPACHSVQHYNWRTHRTVVIKEMALSISPSPSFSSPLSSLSLTYSPFLLSFYFFIPYLSYVNNYIRFPAVCCMKLDSFKNKTV